jgi:hypothetical protein
MKTNFGESDSPSRPFPRFLLHKCSKKILKRFFSGFLCRNIHNEDFSRFIRMRAALCLFDREINSIFEHAKLVWVEMTLEMFDGANAGKVSTIHLRRNSHLSLEIRQPCTRGLNKHRQCRRVLIIRAESSSSSSS